MQSVKAVRAVEVRALMLEKERGGKLSFTPVILSHIKERLRSRKVLSLKIGMPQSHCYLFLTPNEHVS